VGLMTAGRSALTSAAATETQEILHLGFHIFHRTSALNHINVKGKGAYSSLWIGNQSQSYGASPAIWDHTVLPATRHG